MKSLITLLILFFFSLNSFAQPESIKYLKYNTELFKEVKRTQADIYIYEVDTLSLPIMDDFSTSKFRKYNAQPGDANVSGVVFYQLMNGATPLPDTAGFTTTVTNLIEYDTLSDGTDTIYFTPLPNQSITINDLTSYPINGMSTVVYECYNIVDTVYTPRPPDTVYFPCPVVQDSVNVYFVTSIDNSTAIWLDHYAYHNYRFPVHPPTLGVATFEGLDENGYPYDFSSPLSHGICDYLTSKPIDLSGIPLSDSVYLSFYYQPQGLNNEPPNTNDSLVLDFYNPVSSNWEHVWAVPGPNALQDFKQVMIPLLKADYMGNNFAFRFKNYGFRCGNLNNWHLDYVFLDRFRTKNDTIRNDVAFVKQASSLLVNNLQQMPLSHFMTNPVGFMRDTISVFQRNNNNGPHLIGNNNMMVDYETTNLYTVNNPSTPSIAGYTDFKTLFDVDNAGVVFDTSYADSCWAKYQVSFTHNTTPDDCRENDTMRFEQIFANYYAYDDGTAEVTYSLIGEGALVAYKFSMAQSDYLSGIAIHFSPTGTNATNRTFLLTVWDNSGPSGSPGSIIYQEPTLYDVEYGNASNGFHVYPLSNPLLLSGTIYIGWQQTELEELNIGMDLNNNNSSRIYYNVFGTWNNTIFPGSLLMRPVFDNCETAVVSVNEQENLSTTVSIYPNPANSTVFVNGVESGAEIQVFNMTGNKVASYRNVNNFPVTDLPKGIYLINVSTSTGFSTHRLVVE